MVYPHKWAPISYRSSAGRDSSPANDRRSTTVLRNQPEVQIFTVVTGAWLTVM